MRIIFGLVLLVGLSLAGFAVYFAKERFTQYQAALQQQRDSIIETTEIFVVNAPLRYGQPLRPENVTAVAWPADHVPFGAFATMEELFPEGPDVPRTVLRVMERDEPILISKVTAPGEDAGVASRLGNGLRAFALRVDVTSGVSGFLRPGDRVDVYWTGSARGTDVTRLIRSGVQIIAIDQIADEDRNNPTIARTVTIAATPQEIAALTLAQSSGRLTLSLIGVEDDTQSEQFEVSLDDILGIEEEVQEAGPRICYVTTRRAGGEVERMPFPCPDEG
ncbi:Flp pilus assembly protein CpaB [Rhodobacterales bacterium HKCCE3408]|nr:Flp pilus assembly protein CpaB [Rhodobacterales bacterium HKCCE3408]